MAIETECSADRTYIVGEDTLLLEALKKKMIRRNPGPPIPPLPPKSCIFKVPEALRRHNQKAYEPLVVSIGPYHRRSHHKKLQRMETVKQWYLDTLLTRMDISLENFIKSITNKTKIDIIEFEKQAREFYAEPLDRFKQSEFIEIMILDGCFVIQLLWKIVNGVKDEDLKMHCMYRYLCHDLFLLENQLPWFVLSCLYRLTLGKRNGGPTFSVVLLEAFCLLSPLKTYVNSYLQSLKKGGLKVDEEDSHLHILDLIRTSIVFTFKHSEPSRKCLCWFAEKEEEVIGFGLAIPPATALSEAGVRFKKGSAKNLMNIEFKNRVLTTPELAVGELTVLMCITLEPMSEVKVTNSLNFIL